MVASKVKGELALIRLTITQFSSTKSSPKTIFDMVTESSARCGWVTEPMKPLSLYLMWL